MFNVRTITLIILHCSATRCNTRYTAEQCRYDHKHHRGWKDIGYHYYVERDGSIHQGRPESVVGAHCKNHNAHSIGVCYEGGLDASGHAADTRTPAQKAALRTLIEDLHRRYPQAIVLGHRDLSPDLNGNGLIEPNEYLKQCPCFDAMKEYNY